MNIPKVRPKRQPMTPQRAIHNLQTCTLIVICTNIIKMASDNLDTDFKNPGVHQKITRMHTDAHEVLSFISKIPILREKNIDKTEDVSSDIYAILDKLILLGHENIIAFDERLTEIIKEAEERNQQLV